MAAPVEPRILAEVGGLAVAEQGPLVVVVDRGTGPWATFAFVLAVLALVFGGFGAVTLAFAAAGTTVVPWWLSAVFLAAGIGVGLGVLAVVRWIRRICATQLSTYRPVAVFDRAQRVFTDGDGVVIAPLDHVRFQRQTQLASSSEMLVAVTPAGRRIIKRGNPFNGGLGNLESVLTAAVFGPTG
ncbi:hypothetical protein [Mycolicibacterium sp. 624]|uniref:hypothetical protein n=1 Tax=Mycolicibacterium sp. 624 TaxID=3156314 RepID=UPI003398E88E